MTNFKKYAIVFIMKDDLYKHEIVDLGEEDRRAFINPPPAKSILDPVSPTWREICPKGFWGWSKAILAVLITGVLGYIILVLALVM